MPVSRSRYYLFLIQTQPFADGFQNRCSEGYPNIHRKTPVLESLFDKAAGLKAFNFIKKRVQHRRFPVNIAKSLKTAFFVEHLRCPLLLINR